MLRSPDQELRPTELQKRFSPYRPHSVYPLLRTALHSTNSYRVSKLRALDRASRDKNRNNNNNMSRCPSREGRLEETDRNRSWAKGLSSPDREPRPGDLDEGPGEGPPELVPCVRTAWFRGLYSRSFIQFTSGVGQWGF